MTKAGGSFGWFHCVYHGGHTKSDLVGIKGYASDYGGWSVAGYFACCFVVRRVPFQNHRFARCRESVFRCCTGNPGADASVAFVFVVFAQTGMSAVMVAIIGFGLNTAAHVSEIMKSALMAVDAGQVKAARTLGFSAWHAFWYVTFPQAVAFARPMYRNATINLLQWTSVVGYVTISDLTRVINQLGARSAKPFYSLFLGIVIYLFVGYMIHLIFKLTERKGGRVR